KSKVGFDLLGKPAAFSPDGMRLATSAATSGNVLIWDPRTGNELCRLKGHSSLVVSVAFSPDSKRIATAGEEVKLWDVATGKELLSLKWDFRGFSHRSSEVFFSRDGTRLFLSENSLARGVQIWDATPLPEKR